MPRTFVLELPARSGDRPLFKAQHIRNPGSVNKNCRKLPDRLQVHVGLSDPESERHLLALLKQDGWAKRMGAGK